MSSRSMLWYLLVGTRGGANRLRMLERLQKGPMNAHELSVSLSLDYRTVRHHLSLLESAGIVARPIGEVYASPYEVTSYLLANLPALEELQRERTHRSGSRRSSRWATHGPGGGAVRG